MFRDPIRIAGSGLSGLSAAIALARRRHEVDVYERNAGSGQTRHRDWDAIENWTTERDLVDLFADWGLDWSFEYRVAPAFHVFDPRGEVFHVTTHRPFFYLVKRGGEEGSIEHALRRQASALGVRFHDRQARQLGDVDIWAAGAQGGRYFLAAGIVFETDHPDIVAGLVSASYAPKAYSYLVIVDGFGTLAAVLTRDFRRARAYLEASRHEFQERIGFEIRNVRTTSGHGGHVAGFFRHRGRRHPLVVGEAAGFQDFLWGFGIRHALLSGQLAARAIDEGRDFDELVDQEIRPLVRASIVNRLLYDWSGDRGYSQLIRHFAAAPDLVALTRRWYGWSPVRQLLWPVAAYRLRRSEKRDGG